MILRNMSSRALIIKDVSNTEYKVPAYGDLTVSSSLWSDSTFRSYVRYRIRDIVLDADASLSPTTNQVVQPTGASIVPLILKGAVSQSADLQQWQNSSGTVLAQVLSSGTFRLTGASAALAVNASAPSQAVFYTSSTGDTQNRFTIDGNGKFAWGSGSAVADTFMSRSATGQFDFTTTAGTSWASVRVDLVDTFNGNGNPIVRSWTTVSDLNPMFNVTGNGAMSWGVGGSSATDTTLTRTATVGGLTQSQTTTIAAGTGDLSPNVSIPTVNGAFTVTRFNYQQFNNPAGTSTITDAAIFAVNAAAGTHKAIDAGTTKTTPGTVNAWVKVNINGVIHYLPAYTSKTT